MLTLQGRESPFPPGPPSYVAFGVFDGVHRGHQTVLGELVRWARENGGRSVVLTFDRHPRKLLAGSAPVFITSLPHRIRLFEARGIDVCVVLKFDRQLAVMEPEDFVREVLCGWARASGVLLGHDQRFGRGGRGDTELLRQMAPALGLKLRVISAARLGEQIVSSTAIREAIVAGDLGSASRMLGRPVSILGTVVSGQRKGHDLGFPTANLDVHHEVRLPEGVYMAMAIVGERELPAVANIGRRPTFAPRGPAFGDWEAVVEVHILDFDGSLYGQDVEVRFLRRVRDERVFRRQENLRRQIAKDVAEAREYFAEDTAVPQEGRSSGDS